MRNKICFEIFIRFWVSFFFWRAFEEWKANNNTVSSTWCDGIYLSQKEIDIFVPEKLNLKNPKIFCKKNLRHSTARHWLTRNHCHCLIGNLRRWLWICIPDRNPDMSRSCSTRCTREFQDWARQSPIWPWPSAGELAVWWITESWCVDHRPQPTNLPRVSEKRKMRDENNWWSGKESRKPTWG